AARTGDGKTVWAGLSAPLGSMLYTAHIPTPPLSEFVEYLWMLRDAPSHAKECIIPSGTFELVINLPEDEFRIYDSARTNKPNRFSGTFLSGAYQRPFVIDTKEHASVIGVHFKPGGAYSFLRESAGCLANSHVDLDRVIGANARKLRELLCTAATSSDRFQILEAALIARLSRAVRRNDAVQLGIDCLTRHDARVADLAERAEMSHRRFIEL